MNTPTPLRPVAPLLKHYKTLLKLVTRDASLRKQYQPDVDTVLRDIERWLAEAKVAADFAADTYGWDTTIDSNDIEQEDPKERWALERLCDALIEKGALVSLSRKYVFSQVRSFLLTGTFRRKNPQLDEFVPPQWSLVLWTPLLAHIQAYHHTFPLILTTRIVENILCELLNTEFDSDVVSFDIEESQNDPSYRMALARWAVWVVKTYDNSQENGELGLRKNVIVLLASALAPGKAEGVKEFEV